MIRVLPRRQGLPPPHLLQGAGEACAVVRPEAGARHRGLRHLDREAGGRTLPVRRPASEAVHHAVAGAGTVGGRPAREVRPGRGYQVEAGPQWLARVPCPPDPALPGGKRGAAS